MLSLCEGPNNTTDLNIDGTIQIRGSEGRNRDGN